MVFDCSKNRLPGLPQSLVALYGLKVLRLSHNELSSLPAGIEKLSGLKVEHDRTSYTGLDLSGNRLCEVPEKAAAWGDSFNPGWRDKQRCKKQGGR